MFRIFLDAEVPCHVIFFPTRFTDDTGLMHFSRMRSKGSRFTLGVWGLRVCSLDVAFTVATVRNRSQPFATVRNCPREDHMAVPMGSFAEVVLFPHLPGEGC